MKCNKCIQKPGSLCIDCHIKTFPEMLARDIKNGNYVIKDGDLFLKGIDHEIRITRRAK